MNQVIHWDQQDKMRSFQKLEDFVEHTNFFLRWFIPLLTLSSDLRNQFHSNQSKYLRIINNTHNKVALLIDLSLFRFQLVSTFKSIQPLQIPNSRFILRIWKVRELSFAALAKYINKQLQIALIQSSETHFHSIQAIDSFGRMFSRSQNWCSFKLQFAVCD